MRATGDFVGLREGDVGVWRGIRYGREERLRAPVAVASPGRWQWVRDNIAAFGVILLK